VLDLSPLERINYSRFLRLSFSGETFDLFCTLGHAGQRGLRATAKKGRFKPQAWHHVALAWDQARGAAIYVDGVVEGTLKTEWFYDGHISQIGLGITTRPDFRPGGAEFAQSYDELRIYDRWLDPAEVALLAKGGDPELNALDARGWFGVKRKAYGLDAAAVALPEAALGGETGLRQAGPSAAKDVKRTSWRAFDGERGRRWPGGAGYTDAGRRLDIWMHPNQPFDAVQCFGAGPLKLVAGEGASLLAVDDKALTTARALLPAPVTAERLAVIREGGVVYELSLLQRTPFDAGAFAVREGWQHYGLRAAGPDDEGLPEMDMIRQTFYTPDQGALISANAPGVGRIRAPAMAALHLIGPAHEARQGVGAVALNLAILSNETGPMRLEVVDPLNPERYAVVADVRLTGAAPGRLRLSFDFRDLVMPAKARPRIVLTFAADTELDLAGSSIAWKWLPVAEALREFAPDQLARGKDVFQEISESRPWGHSPERLRTLGTLTNVINELRALLPEDSVVASYWHWIHPREQKAILSPPPVPPGVPAWAVYWDAAVPLLKQVPYWWIANRENDRGEFGANDGINDDTDLVQDWWAMHLMRGPDPALYDSLKRVADNSWKVTMRETGLGHVTDTLHTYEDGMNAQCHMALMAYGNPVYFERLLASVRHYKDLMGVNAAGHLHFRASDYGRGPDGRARVSGGARAYDAGWNALTLQPGMLVGWYNGDPYCRKVVRDWTDAMMEHSLKELPQTKRLTGFSVRFDTDAATPARSFGYGFFDAPWACYDWTGEKKYLDFIRLGIESEFASYRHPRQTGIVADRYIALTGDTALGPRYVAAAKDPALWRSSLHNDNYYELDAFYLAWQCTGDLAFIDEGMKLTLNDIAWELPMLTQGEQSTDRVWTPQRLANRVALGGSAMLRNELYPRLGASWEHATGRLAPFVRVNRRDRLEAWVCNLDEREASVTMRVWGLDHGRYRIRQGPDRNLDGRPDTEAETRATLARFETLALKLPPRTVWLVVCEQEEALDDIRARPDLAVCAEDAAYDPETGRLTFIVHNIGAKGSGPYDLRVAAGGKVLLDLKGVPALDPPLDQFPKTATFQVEGLKGREDVPVVVDVDPAGRLREIARPNNRAELLPSRLPAPAKATP